MSKEATAETMANPPLHETFMAEPSKGRIVHYCLSLDDCATIVAHRGALPSQPQAKTPKAGDIAPMIITEVDQADPNFVAGIVFTNGLPVYFVAGARRMDDPAYETQGNWRWPERIDSANKS